MKIKDSYIARRKFLCGMIGGGAVALGAGTAVPLTYYAGNLRQQPPPPSMMLEPAEYEGLLPGQGKLLGRTYGHIPVLLVQTPGPESELRIFDATCTHFTCVVKYEDGEDHIYCACHEGFFDLDGREKAGPPPAPLTKFEKRVKDGQLYIALEKENLEDEKLEDAIREPDA